MVECQAAICVAPGKPLVVETVKVAAPRRGEALVEIVATGLCHTDLTAIDGSNATTVYPAILGHEGAGRVVEIGRDVEDFKVGDHVIPLYGPECGHCRMCVSRKTNLCWTIKSTRDRGTMPDGTARFTCAGEPVHHFMGTSTFSRYTVVPEIALAKIRPDAPLEKICLLGCGVTTGVGAALNDVQPGDNVVVFGLGGIGVNVLQGARIAGAAKIIGVDPNPDKQALARQLGMTDFVDARIDGRAVVEAVHELTDGGVDAAFECTGLIPVMRQALDSCHVGWGVCVLLGVEPKGAELGVPPVMVRYGRTVKGSYFGGVKGRSGLGRYVDLYMDGELQIDPLITHRLRLDEINQGFELMTTGRSVRSVIDFE